MDSTKKLPDFIFVGPLKTATSYIYNYYSHHPNVNTSEPIKELYFYDKHYSRGENWYLKHFSPRPEHMVMIDISPSYMIEQEAVKRIKKDNPNAKIIMTLRDPVERYLSHVKHHISHGHSYNGFEDLLEKHPKIFRGSQYEDYAKSWITEFGEENVSILDYHELTKDPVTFMQKVCEIIEVPFNNDYNFEHKVNPAGTARSPLFMRIVHVIMRFLIKNGFANIIKAVKQTGLKSLMVKEGSNFEISEEDLTKANEYFKNSTQWYKSRFAHPII